MICSKTRLRLLYRRVIKLNCTQKSHVYHPHNQRDLRTVTRDKIKICYQFSMEAKVGTPVASIIFIHLFTS